MTKKYLPQQDVQFLGKVSRDRKIVTEHFEVHHPVYVKKSSLMALDLEGKPTIPIGKGLFCSTELPPNTMVARFLGELISSKEAMNRKLNPKVGYAPIYQVFLNNDQVIDCFNYYENCVASKVNSSLNLVNPITNKMLQLMFGCISTE